jgi:hypothetical protein
MSSETSAINRALNRPQLVLEQTIDFRDGTTEVRVLLAFLLCGTADL